jgi:hypothetical protein
VAARSIFASGVYRIHAAKWLFPQEKATLVALAISTSEAKMLLTGPSIARGARAHQTMAREADKR